MARKPKQQAQKKPKKKMGRPKKVLDQATFEGLCGIQCTKQEIISVLKCDEKTLTGWCKRTYGEGFSDIHKKLSANGKMSLRRMQWASAKNGSIAMQIWLGKQYLDQSEPKDKQDIDDSVLESKEIQFVIKDAKRKTKRS